MRQSEPGSALESATDEELAGRTLTGEREAFGALWDRHHLGVYGFAMRRVGHREVAEDATAEAFRRALANLASYRGGGFRPWLFAIARNVLIDEGRGRRPTIPLENAPDADLAADAPYDRALASAELARVAALLDRLTPTEREVLELRLAGLSPAEIAQTLGKARHAIDVAHYRAVARVRSLLGIDGGHRDA